MQCASRRAISPDEPQGRVILQEHELATPDPAEHKTAAAAGVDNSKKTVPEAETAQDCMVVADFVDEDTRTPGKCETSAAESPYADYAGNSADWPHWATVIGTEMCRVGSILWADATYHVLAV